NKKSGLLGVSGISSDLRDIESAADKGDKRAKLAEDILTYDVKKYIGAYAAAMGGIDALVFTAGVGENSAATRAAVCEGLEFLGIKIDAQKNDMRGKEMEISAAGSRVHVLVIPTNEELMIARDTKRLAF
ncbi:MAG: acetate kinase, partial [Fretibacterium sp.]|nr:acetate kinase [Fretibacterium sp.]